MQEEEEAERGRLISWCCRYVEMSIFFSVIKTEINPTYPYVLDERFVVDICLFCSMFVESRG